ncbi:MAG: hypothetical protein KY455_12520 [Euryarchaeota archaeon]|nr:hypothetical protein [Euryarchaeota archaeon]
MLCPDCGVETESLTAGSCPRCFQKRNALAEVEPYVDVYLCAHCGGRRDGSGWTDPDGRSELDMIDGAVIRAVRVHTLLEVPEVTVAGEPQDDKHYGYDIMVDGEVEGVSLEAMVETTARVKRTVCASCSRQQGGYFNAIVQFRGRDRDPSDEERQEAGDLVVRELDRMRRSGNQAAFLTKQGKVKGGHDFFISEIDVARIVAKKLVDRFDAELTESAKLMGRQNGRDVHRVTFLVRMPHYRRGDFVLHRDLPAQVDRIDRKTVQLRDLVSGRQMTVPRDEIGRTDVVASREAVKEVQVVSVVRDEALILDPMSNRTYEVRLPENVEYDLSIRSFEVVEHDDQYYYVGLPRRRGSLPVI